MATAGVRLSGKTVIVTGAAQGIGLATARACAHEGARVVLSDVQDDKGRREAEELRRRGFEAIFARADVADSTSVEAMVREVVTAFGKPDALVNNAGIAVFRDPLNMAVADWKDCFSVDLDGVWNCCRAVLPHMVEAGKGDIINIASVHSFKIIPGCFPYPVAKHAVVGLTRALAIEYAARDIRVNAVAPGYIDTEIVKSVFDQTGEAVGARRRVEAMHPVNRIGQPEEIAATVVFLASDEARFLTAECITVDGGRSILFHE